MRNCQQAGVAAGCTPLSQVYDIGLAAQCNARVKREKDLLRRRIRQKAQAEGVRPRYAVREKEILLLALAHHDEAVIQNRDNNAVLRAARQAGWLSFRPDHEGKLVSCDNERWCRGLLEGSDRMPKFPFFQDRGKWILEGVVQDLTEEEAKQAAASAFQREVAEVHEKQAAGVVLDFQGSEVAKEDAGLGLVAASVLDLCQSQEDKEFLIHIQEAQQRSRIFQEKAKQIAAAPSQKKIPKVPHRLRKKTSCKAKSLKEKRQAWRQKLGTKTPQQGAFCN